jgi:hypothetical protein
MINAELGAEIVICGRREEVLKGAVSEWTKRGGRASSLEGATGIFASHQSPESRVQRRGAIASRRATLRYLPNYSPDLNPIELANGKFKALQHKVARQTVLGLVRTIRSFVPLPGPKNALATSGTQAMLPYDRNRL